MMNINLEKEIKMEKQVLSIEQMEELEKLGIDISGASMFWYINGKFKQLIPCSNQDTISDWTNQHGENCIIPAFTLQDILEMLPKNIIHSNKQLKTCNYKLCTFDNKVMYTFNSFDQCWLKCTCGKNLLEAAFDMLKWVKQNNYI